MMKSDAEKDELDGKEDKEIETNKIIRENNGKA